jgi:hypothetical protein
MGWNGMENNSIKIYIIFDGNDVHRLRAKIALDPSRAGDIDALYEAEVILPGVALNITDSQFHYGYGSTTALALLGLFLSFKSKSKFSLFCPDC